MIEKLNSWLVLAAIVIGVSSTAATVVIANSHSHADHVALCQAETRQNKQTRDFIAGLVASPKTPQPVRQQLVAAALANFPLVPIDCVPR